MSQLENTKISSVNAEEQNIMDVDSVKDVILGGGSKVKRNPHRVIYTSSYDRGCLHLLEIWPEVKKAVPDAILDIYYGWDLFDKFYKGNPSSMKWKEGMLNMMKADGITEHGRIPQHQVAEEMGKSGVWAYPVHFGEINCCVGDTPILMPRDHKKYPYGIPIKDLEGKSGFYVYSYDHDTDRIVLGKVKWVKITKHNAKLLRITLDDGTILRFTPEHKFLLRDGTYKEARDLVIGESLMPCYEKPTFAVKQMDGSWPEEHRMTAESLWGDGIKGMIVDHKNGNRFDNTPDNLQLLTPSEHTRKISITERPMTNLYKKHMKEAQQKLSKTPERKEFFSRLGVLRANKFWNTFRTWDLEKQKKWTTNRQLQKNHSVIEVCEDLTREDVYDMEVDKYHTFAAGGVFVHNCITALKAQAYGAVPVVVNYAALETSVQFGIKIKGDIYDEEVKKEFTKQLIWALQNPDWQEQVRKPMMDWAIKKFPWSEIAKTWDDEFNGKPVDFWKEPENKNYKLIDGYTGKEVSNG